MVGIAEGGRWIPDVQMKVERRKSVRMANFSWAFSCLCGLLAIIWSSRAVIGADLVIRIPGDLSQQDGYYRLDYRKDPVLILLYRYYRP